MTEMHLDSSVHVTANVNRTIYSLYFVVSYKVSTHGLHLDLHLDPHCRQRCRTTRLITMPKSS